MRIAEQTELGAGPPVVAAFRGRTALVTGAAGSIGSELARQAAALPLARLVLLDRDENALFELLRSFDSYQRPPGGVQIAAALGDIRDDEFVRHTFARWRPDIVLHAAAYKHVPMMEANPCEAVLNNVTGTRTLADAALNAGCECFLLVSTDKAAQPSSVMGASKRVAELVVQQYAAMANVDALFNSVRFVNVYGSRGSVVPIFLAQIAAGGPVTVTHGEMRRYFMPIGEAARLLLCTATLRGSGSIYALEAGGPVQIVDLARQLIEDAGLVPDEDIAIEFIGVRPGEKLCESLAGDNEPLVATDCPGVNRIRFAASTTLDPALLEELESAARHRDSARVVEMLRQLPIGYTPAAWETHDGASPLQFSGYSAMAAAKPQVVLGKAVAERLQ